MYIYTLNLPFLKSTSIHTLLSISFHLGLIKCTHAHRLTYKISKIPLSGCFKNTKIKTKKKKNTESKEFCCH